MYENAMDMEEEGYDRGSHGYGLFLLTQAMRLIELDDRVCNKYTR